MAGKYASAGRIHFLHSRNIKFDDCGGGCNFHESPHPNRIRISRYVRDTQSACMTTDLTDIHVPITAEIFGVKTEDLDMDSMTAPSEPCIYTVCGKQSKKPLKIRSELI